MAFYCFEFEHAIFISCSSVPSSSNSEELWLRPRSVAVCMHSWFPNKDVWYGECTWHIWHELNSLVENCHSDRDLDGEVVKIEPNTGTVINYRIVCTMTSGFTSTSICDVDTSPSERLESCTLEVCLCFYRILNLPCQYVLLSVPVEVGDPRGFIKHVTQQFW
jgi:hypothetical protein